MPQLRRHLTSVTRRLASRVATLDGRCADRLDLLVPVTGGSSRPLPGEPTETVSHTPDTTTVDIHTVKPRARRVIAPASGGLLRRGVAAGAAPTASSFTSQTTAVPSRADATVAPPL